MGPILIVLGVIAGVIQIKSGGGWAFLRKSMGFLGWMLLFFWVALIILGVLTLFGVI